MKHINESIRDRRGGAISVRTGSFLELIDNQISEYRYRVLYVSGEDLNRSPIKEMIGKCFPGSPDFINKITKSRKNVLVWYSTNDARYFCQPIKDMYGCDYITNLPLPSKGGLHGKGTFVIDQVPYGERYVDITKYKRIIDCFNGHFVF